MSGKVFTEFVSCCFPLPATSIMIIYGDKLQPLSGDPGNYYQAIPGGTTKMISRTESNY